MTHALRPLAATKAAVVFVFVLTVLVSALAPSADAGTAGGSAAAPATDAAN